MANKRIIDLNNSSQLDEQDYIPVYNAEPTADSLTYKAKIADVLNLKSVTVNGKTGNSITITPDDINDATSAKKFVTSSEKDKISLVRNDLGSNVFLSGDGTYRAMGSFSGGTTIAIVNQDSSVSTDNQNTLMVVDTSTNPVIITLPASPNDKQSIVIKDGGNANANSIVIDGNGKSIEDSSEAMVNTDFGALKMIFIELLDKWLVISFVN